MAYTFSRQSIIEKALLEYSIKGCVTEDYILDLINEYDLPLSEVSLVCDEIVIKGVVICDDAINDKYSIGTDYSHTDYRKTFDDVVSIDESLKVFIDYVRCIQPPQWREAQYLLPQAKAGNPYAKQRIVEMYLRVVIRIALSFHKKYGFPLADTIQEGCLGLIIALNKYELDRSGVFATYAPWWVRQVITREFSVGNPIMYFPVHVSERLSVVYEIKKKHACEQCVDSIICVGLVSELSDKLSCSLDDAMQFIRYIESFESIEMLFEENELVFCDHGAFESEMFDRVVFKELRSLTADVIGTLKWRERDVLQYRFGLLNDEQLTLEQVGSIYGLTRERIRQIEAKAIKKMQHPSRRKRLKEFYL